MSSSAYRSMAGPGTSTAGVCLTASCPTSTEAAPPSSSGPTTRTPDPELCQAGMTSLRKEVVWSKMKPEPRVETFSFLDKCLEPWRASLLFWGQYVYDWLVSSGEGKAEWWCVGPWLCWVRQQLPLRNEHCQHLGRAVTALFTIRVLDSAREFLNESPWGRWHGASPKPLQFPSEGCHFFSCHSMGPIGTGAV
jgi:hypothetical protein